MQILLALIPILTFIVMWAAFHERLHDWRSAFLAAAVLWAVFLVIVTELLSLFRAVTFVAVLAVWLVALLIALAWARRELGHPSNLWASFRLPHFTPFEWVLLSFCAFIAAATALLAFIAPPNTNDALTYHMPRVMHWIQNRSVAFYPTFNIRQIDLVPGAEFIILHLQLLAGSDRLANFVQWFSMVGSAVGVSLIARELGANARGQLFSAIASMTLPMGILQSTSAQTDYVTAFWLVSFVFWMLLLRSKASLPLALAAGTSIGLAAFTKSTAYLFAPPFVVWFAVLLIKAYRARALVLFSVIGLAFLAMNLGGYIRNYGMFGNPLALGQGGMQGTVANRSISVPGLVSNVIRDTAINLGTPFPRVNSFLERRVRAIHQRIGISADDKGTTFGGYSFAIPPIAFNEDMDGNLLHSLLFGASFILIIVVSRGRGTAFMYALCTLLAFLLFCLYLRWQPWGSRLELPLFVLFSPVFGKALGDLRSNQAANSIALVLALAALPWVFLNSQRPLIGTQTVFNTDRISLLFRGPGPGRQASYTEAVAFLNQRLGSSCGQLGLYDRVGDVEYGLWALLDRAGYKDIVIESVGVNNISGRAYRSFPEFAPCAIFVVGPTPKSPLQVKGTTYAPAWQSTLVNVYTPQP